MMSLDVETTGLDLRHGAMPFLVTITYEDGKQVWWEWKVDPKTRKPSIPESDLLEIQEEIDVADSLVLQNPKYDCLALRVAFASVGQKLQWDWDKVYDTLLAGHLLASNQRHDLTTMAMVYLRTNIQPLNDVIKEATNAARAVAKSKYSSWRIAKPGLPEMPSVKKSTPKKDPQKIWKNDMWLPRAIAKAEGYSYVCSEDTEQTDDRDPRLDNHPWWTVCSEYANGDSGVTLPLFLRQREILEKRELWAIYLERLKVLPVVAAMEDAGITLSGKRKDELEKKFRVATEKSAKLCVSMSGGKIKELPKGITNELRSILFDHFKLESGKKTPSGSPSVDKYALDDWIAMLPPRSKAGIFVKNLRAYRKRMTALGYLESYEKFWLPENMRDPETNCGYSGCEWYRLFPSLNPTGAKTLRFSSQSPNEQQISAQEETNLRYCFGPAPDREWYSLDANNIELRIPAYEAGEEEMIDLFERPNGPPRMVFLISFSLCNSSRQPHIVFPYLTFS